MRVRLPTSIGATIFGAFIVMGLLTALVGGYSLYVLESASGFVVRLYDRPLMAINFDRAASLDFAEMDKALVQRTGASEVDRAMIDARIEQLSRTFAEDLAVAAARSLADDEKVVIQQIQRLVARWNDLRQGRDRSSTPDELDQLATQVLRQFDMLAELATGHSFVERRKVMAAIGNFRYSSLAALGAALAFSAIITFFLVRRIIRPLRNAAAVADRIADGELQTPIPPGGHDETGLLLRSMSVMQQRIREMVEREQAQRRSAQNRLVEALENSHEGIVLVDAEDRIVIANSQVASFFPMLARRLGGNVTFSETFGRVEALLKASAAAEPTADVLGFSEDTTEREFRLADDRWIRISRSRTEEGGFFLLISDFSDVKEREERLDETRHQAEAASAAKSTFLANMSHELRTPLNAIIGFSELLSSQMVRQVGSEAQVQYARDIWQSGSHLLAIINSVLDLSKSEAGKLQLACNEVDLGELVESSLKMMGEQCSRAELSLTAALPDFPLRLWADGAKLRQVLLNLLSNAVKFTEPGGVAVSAEAAADGSVTMRVVDNGIGMSAEEIPVAFAAFGQVDNRLARRYEGTGLGLPLSKALVQLHGGTITIDSTPGEGTTVIVTLPKEATQPTAAAA